MRACSLCNGQGVIKNPGGSLFQKCPLCDGSGQERRGGMPFAFILERLPLNANVLNDQSALQIQLGDFVPHFLVAASSGIFSAQLSDLSKQQPFSDAKVHRDNLFGTAQNPSPWLPKYVFKNGSRIGVVLDELSGANNNIRIAVHGTIYPE